MANRTIPSQPIGGVPRGRETVIPSKADLEEQRGKRREKESAHELALAGYNVEQNPPPLSNGKRPDYLIEGQVFDNYAPGKNITVRNIVSNIQRKIDRGQSSRFVLNLNDSPVSIADLQQQFTQYPNAISGLEEIIIVKDGQVTPFFPFIP